MGSEPGVFAQNKETGEVIVVPHFGDLPDGFVRHTSVDVLIERLQRHAHYTADYGEDVCDYMQLAAHAIIHLMADRTPPPPAKETE